MRLKFAPKFENKTYHHFTPISGQASALLMALKHIRRLPIVRDDKLVGIITARDLVEAYAK